MNPERRMNELELIVAENVQKTDRLIDGQGQLLELATRSQEDINTIRTTGSKLSSTTDSTARAVAKLTVSTQADFASVRQDIATLSESTQAGFDKLVDFTQAGFNTVDERFNTVDERFNAVDERFNTVDERFNTVDEQIGELRTEMNQQIGELKTEMNQRFNKFDQRFDQLITLIQNRLS